MASAGRKRKPTALKVLQGNAGKRALPENEPQPTRAKKTPPAPKWLTEDAQGIWREVAREAHGMRVLTAADHRALGLLCEALARWQKAKGQIEETGGEIVTTTQGNLVQNPWVAVMNRAAKDAAGLLAEFGMTPSSRSRVQMVESKEDDPFAAFMRRK